MTILKESDESVLVRGILAKMAAVSEDATLSELFHLAISLLLRRAEDHALKENILVAARILLDELKNQPERRDEILPDLRRLIEKARDERPKRETIQSEPPKIIALQPRIQHRSLVTKAAALILGIGSLSAMALLVTSFWWHTPPAFAYGMNAPSIAKAILTLPEGKDEEKTIGAMSLHRLNGNNGQVVVMANDVPRRLCPAVGALLGAKGPITIGGARPISYAKPVLERACFRDKGDVSLTWSLPSDRPDIPLPVAETLTEAD